jgi:hypothetical protein
MNEFNTIFLFVLSKQNRECFFVSIIADVLYSYRGHFFLILVVMAIPPQVAYVTLDKNKNLLMIKKFKFLFWDQSIQYPLTDILEANLGKETICTGM